MGEPPEDPFAPLVAVHEDFVDKLTELEATLDEMMATRETREGNDIILDEAVRFFEEELIPHLRLEDEAVLPPIQKGNGRDRTLPAVRVYQHQGNQRGGLEFDEGRDDPRHAPAPSAALQGLNP